MTWADEARARVAANMDAYGLSRRQREVAWAMFSTASYAEMGCGFCLSESTVKNVAYEIGKKVGVSSRVAIVLRLLDVDGLSEA